MILKLHLRSILFFVALFNLTVLSAQQDGSVDPAFNPIDNGIVNGITGGTGVYVMLELQEGKVIVAGDFTKYDGQTFNDILRLNNDESIDPSFNSGAGVGGSIQGVIELSDGKLLIHGYFTDFNGNVCNSIARLNQSGSFDTTFSNQGIPANRVVTHAKVTPEGKIVVFYRDSATGLYTIARLNTDGTADNTFTAAVTSDWVTGIAIQPDGKILIHGQFYNFNGFAVNGLVRLNINGSVDTSFNTNLPDGIEVTAVAVQTDGKIVLNYYSDTEGSISRFDSDGSPDTSFSAPEDLLFGSVSSIILQGDKFLVSYYSYAFFRLNNNGSYDVSFNLPDIGEGSMSPYSVAQNGRIYIGGSFVSLNNTRDDGLARLNSDGTKDLAFDSGGRADTGADSTISNVLVSPDNKILISGSFRSYNGILNGGIVRLNGNGTQDTSFNLDPSVKNHQIASFYPGGKVIVIVPGSVKRLNADGNLDTTFTSPPFTGIEATGTTISSVVVLPDGKIIVAGRFNKVGNIPVQSICRLNSDGSFDAAFSSNVLNNATVVKVIHLPQEQKLLIGSISAPSALMKIDYNGIEDAAFNHTPVALMFWLESFAVESDGKILAVGYGEGVPYYKQRLIRFNANGTVNQVMLEDDYGVNIQIRDIIASSNGKYYVLGRPGFIPLAGATFARFNNNGTIDNTFIPGIGANVNDVAFYENKIVIVGGFNNYNGTAKNNIVGVYTSGFLSTDEPQSVIDNIIIYRQSDYIKISAESNIQNVDVFDLQGRLVSKTSDVHNTNVSLPVVQKGAVLIVKVTQTDGAVVTKKIY